MLDVLATAVIIVALLAATGTAGLALLRRRLGQAALGGLAAVELLALVQVVAAVVLLAGGERGAGDLVVVEFVGYHLATLLVLPAGVAWTRADRSRWSPLVVTVAALALAVMVVRLNQLWAGTGG